MIGRARRATALAGLAYLALALVLWSGAWLHHPTESATCGCGDTALLTWAMAWPAYAISHGHSLLFTTRLYYPYGINIPANTTALAWGVLLTPVTWLFGPAATLNVATTAAPVLAALAARAMARRWCSWSPAAFVVGLAYGFSPYVLEILTLQHIDTGTLVTPPLILLCLDKLLFQERSGDSESSDDGTGSRSRVSQIRTGILLGLLVVVQFFLSAEILAITALAAAFGLGLLVVVGAVIDPEALAARVQSAWKGMAVATGVALVLLAYPAAYAVFGPRPIPKEAWPDLAYFGGPIRTVLVANPVATRGPNAIQETFGYFGTHSLPLAYLGIGWVALLLGGLVLCRRDRRLWFCGAMLIFLELCALGNNGGLWRLVQRLPLLANVTPDRIPAVADLFAALALGLLLDHAHRWVLTRTHRPAPAPAPAQTHVHEWLSVAAAWLLPCALALVALGPIAVQESLPYVVRPLDVPKWFTTVATRLPASTVVLTYPFPASGLQDPLTWQAMNGIHFSMVGGPASPTRPTETTAADRQAANLLDALSNGWIPPKGSTTAQVHLLRRAMHDWGVTTIVVPDPTGEPAALRPRSVPHFLALMIDLFGTPPTRQADAWVWTVPAAPAPSLLPSSP